MNQSFLFFELIGIFIVHWLILEPQTYVVVEQFGAENIPLLSGRLVLNFSSKRTLKLFSLFHEHVNQTEHLHCSLLAFHRTLASKHLLLIIEVKSEYKPSSIVDLT